jgi:hypothetical protein
MGNINLAQTYCCVDQRSAGRGCHCVGGELVKVRAGMNAIETLFASTLR